MALTRDSIVKRTVAAMSTPVDDELVIIHFDSNAYYGFDVIGRRIWELIEHPRKVTDLCMALREEYDVAEDRCETDVLSFLGELARSRVVESNDVVDA